VFWIVLAIFMLALIIPLALLIFYLITRLRFAFFHCLVNQTTEIRPGWRLYRIQAMRFFLLNLVAGFLFLVLAVVLCLPFFFAVIHMAAAGPSQPFDFGAFLRIFLPFLGYVLAICLFAYVIDVILRDFMLPHIALEDATVSQAWAAVRSHIGREKGAFTLYFVLRLILPIIGFIVLFIVALILGLILLGISADTMIGLNAWLGAATGFGAVLLILIKIVLGTVAFAVGVVLAISIFGPFSTWVRNYALFFYGGRYQALGDLLSPPPPPPSLPDIAGTPEAA
jgi:hypothetical protein